jgi:speckle-type POZ protein
MATLCGEKKKMEEFSCHWEQSWRDSAFERVPCYCGQKPNLLVIFDFRSPIEDCVLNQLPSFDVYFHVQGKIFGAHKSVVSASPVMAAMFQGNYINEKSSENIEITDVPPQVFKHVLIFMYSGKTPHTSASTSLFEMLFFTADKYQIQALRDVSESKLVHKVSREDAIHFLKIAHIHSAPKLMEASHQCIENNRDYIWETQEWKDLMRKYPELFFHASRRMAAER